MNITNHPSLCFSQDLASICKPLSKLNISYFSHAKLDKNKQFSAINNHPDFMELYLNNNYFNIGIHMMDPEALGHYVVVDAFESKGLSAKMHQEAAALGIKHFFTIVDKSKSDCDEFYHFASHASEKTFNQTYLTHLDLLKLFIQYFNETIKQSKTLGNAYDMKFNIDPQAAGFTINENQYLIKKRLEFLDVIKQKKSRLLIHKNTQQSLLLSPRQSKCLFLLCKGKTTKEIAFILNLSHRTVENYLMKTRKILGCRNMNELLVSYISQVLSPQFDHAD